MHDFSSLGVQISRSCANSAKSCAVAWQHLEPLDMRTGIGRKSKVVRELKWLGSKNGSRTRTVGEKNVRKPKWYENPNGRGSTLVEKPNW